MTTPVAVRDASISLSGRPVVHGVDLTVTPGEFVALLGTNGSGKSTLMRAAVGLIPLSSGSVSLFGTPVRRFNQWWRIGYVPQKSTAASGVPSTVREVVMSGRLARRRFAGIPTSADRRAVADAIAAVGLAERARDSATELSGGQQQRVMIARGLAGKCDLLIMDEPTAGVDQHSQEVLAGLFGSLLDHGRSIWMVAHELGPFESMIDRAVVLRDGRVAFDGPCAYATREPHNQHHPHISTPPHAFGIDAEGAWTQ